MRDFAYSRAKSVKEAQSLVKDPSRFIAGGTTLIDLMKLEVETPSRVIDLNHLPLRAIDWQKDNSVRVGAMVRNTELAQDDGVVKNFAVLSEALLAGASTQIRNKASVSGNLLQRTRCVYFRDPSKPCNKRSPGSGCSAIEGHNRNLAILGTSDKCIATNPSDMNVALMALETSIRIQPVKGDEKIVPMKSFYQLPGSTPEKENVLTAGDLITGIDIPALPPATRSTYLKLRDRASYEFALSSAAVVMTKNGANIARVRMAMGGIGTIPWRSEEAERFLEGKTPSENVFREAAEILLKGAKPASENGFKVELAKRCLVSALKTVAEV